MGNGIWSSEPEKTRGGATARAFRLETAKGRWDGKVFEGPLTHGRRYTEAEIWENYTHFIRQVVPVAEELGIRIGIHPDDPPVPELGGVPRCIFGNFAGYTRALEIANSPNIGVCLCCGTWLEGGAGMGKDVIEAIRAFAKMGKLWKIHFRNVSAPVPHFVETFVDNGMMDMWKVMKTLVEVVFRGALIGVQHGIHPGAARQGGSGVARGIRGAWPPEPVRIAWETRARGAYHCPRWCEGRVAPPGASLARCSSHEKGLASRTSQLDASLLARFTESLSMEVPPGGKAPAVSRPDERETLALPSTRIAVFTHDTFGLGHVRRSLHIIRALALRAPRASILLITGCPAIRALEGLPANADHVKIPTVVKTGSRGIP
jgi:sugar phosphate isomerase/epimerase